MLLITSNENINYTIIAREISESINIPIQVFSINKINNVINFIYREKSPDIILGLFSQPILIDEYKLSILIF